MKITDRAHSDCEYVAVLKMWKFCRAEGPRWTYEFLKNMAGKARRHKRTETIREKASRLPKSIHEWKEAGL